MQPIQPAQRLPVQQPPPVKIYNAVYSSVQVYECMVRGIAVMRRRADSYVNATQILKVAGVDKGRRTKILEKEILPGKHEIVQGGYGKYQGTWIPLERGRDIALQYGVAPLLAPLFDFVPNTNPMGSLPPSLASVPGLAPPPIMPGSALRLLNQGRAQGLFTPSTSTGYPPGFPSIGPVSPTPPPLVHPSLKRNHSQLDLDHPMPPALTPQTAPPTLAASPDIQMLDRSRPASTAPQAGGGPSPSKRARTEPPVLPDATGRVSPAAVPLQPHATMPPPAFTSTGHRPSPSAVNGLSRPPSSQSVVANGKAPEMKPEPQPQQYTIRFASKPSIPRTMDHHAPARDTRRAAIVQAICARDDPKPVLDMIREIPPDIPALATDVDLVLDEQGHTALHIAASTGRHSIVEALLAAGADVHRGNFNGETALMRACLATHCFDTQSFHTLVAALHASIRTLDTARRSVFHHIVATAGVKGRAVAARYYLDQVNLWIVNHERADFRSIIDIQDEHGDTALNIAARVGNRSLVRVLLDAGANKLLANKLGLRPGDFGVETEELGGSARSEDILSSLRSVPSVPIQKSQDVIADITSMIHGLGNDFASEVKSKQDALDVTQVHLRAATRELSEQRRQIQHWQARCGELDQTTQRVRNLERALNDEDAFDWTGRTELDGADAGPSAGPAFQARGQGATAMAGVGGAGDVPANLDVDPTVPLGDSAATLVRLRRLKMWYSRVEQLMETRMRSLQGASAEKEFQCKKIVALCTGVPIDRVEELLENLVVAMESEAQVIDISRVSGFMQKVRNGVI
ncbi:apses-domain-containing protein [Dichomitus squalens LYAD-421 SS1]|uniref:apses-domain-containing protein n=1 Tax=Dichomitus squalens (strain LYAD-421) TaxID=732165 RepID=UPI0004414130|nr:apses-domain-containing protein [Dichomitus squalens LYAD-421 SS1]EJF64115.1 apses-domain-containing protein [Dichomitus squalens LYAD-421 SS1]